MRRFSDYFGVRDVFTMIFVVPEGLRDRPLEEAGLKDLESQPLIVGGLHQDGFN
jgi:hypothetical protein